MIEQNLSVQLLGGTYADLNERERHFANVADYVAYHERLFETASFSSKHRDAGDHAWLVRNAPTAQLQHLQDALERLDKFKGNRQWVKAARRILQSAEKEKLVEREADQLRAARDDLFSALRKDFEHKKSPLRPPTLAAVQSAHAVIKAYQNPLLVRSKTPNYYLPYCYNRYYKKMRHRANRFLQQQALQLDMNTAAALDAQEAARLSSIACRHVGAHVSDWSVLAEKSLRYAVASRDEQQIDAAWKHLGFFVDVSKRP